MLNLKSSKIAAKTNKKVKQPKMDEDQLKFLNEYVFNEQVAEKPKTKPSKDEPINAPIEEPIEEQSEEPIEELVDDNIVQESMDTGVVYKITNKVNGKIYIGSAFSYEKHGTHPATKYGGVGRFSRHCSNAFSGDPDKENECPDFYKALREYGKECFMVETLKICSKKHLKEYETRIIDTHKSYDERVGYNIFVGTKKPKDENRKKVYEDIKAKTNVDRAKDGSLKKAEHNQGLPPNINYRKNKNKYGLEAEGYFVQIKIDGVLYNKGFLSGKLSMEEKLEEAKKWLADLKQKHNIK